MTTQVTAEAFAKMTEKEKAVLFNAMQAERDALAAKVAQKATLTIKYRDPAKKYPDGKGNDVDGSGAFSLYGLGRFPVTLYAAGWERLLADATRDMILNEIKAHPDAPRK